MSADIRIEFDRHDRVYRGGELVRGQVVVVVHDDVECRAVTLDRYWRTAGKGNVDRGPRATATLFSGVWKAGQTCTYRFHFTAPAAPLSYRGQLLRIDHVVEARADVPWAFDPKAVEPFYVQPGGETGPVETGPIAIDHDPEAGALAALGGKAGYIIAAGLFLFGLLIMPVGLALWIAAVVVLAITVFNSAAAMKVGEVEVAVPILVHPGDTVPIRLSFTPNSEVRYRKVEARLIGVERCISGSGKQRRTHRHVIHDAAFLIADEGHAAAASRTEFTGAVRVPDTDAFSIDATANKIVWRVVLRIDIANWPSWKHSRVLRVLPMTVDRVEPDPQRQTEHAAEAPTPPPPPPRRRVEPLAEPIAIAEVDAVTPVAPAAPDLPPPAFASTTPAVFAAAASPLWPSPSDDRTSPDAERPASATLSPTDEPTAPPPVEPPASHSPQPPLAPAPVPADLNVAINRLAVADRFNGERDRLLAELAATPFCFTVRLDKIEWTISMSSAPEYRSGRTVVGRIVGSDKPVAVRFPDATTPQIEAMKKGDSLDVTARMVEWNSLYDRAECEAYVAG